METYETLIENKKKEIGFLKSTKFPNKANNEKLKSLENELQILVDEFNK